MSVTPQPVDPTGSKSTTDESQTDSATFPVATARTALAETEKTSAQCAPDSAFAIRADAFEIDPLGQIAELQAKLADAVPPEEPSIMRELAAGYLSIGFGDEALALLTNYQAQNSLLADIARAISERQFQQNSQLMGARQCGGN